MLKNILKFNWILDIKADSIWIFLLIIPPIYILWIYKIGRLGEQILNSKRNWFFCVLSFLYFAFSCAFIIDVLSKEDTLLHFLYVSKIDFRITLLFFCLLVLSWFYFIYYATRMSIKLDEFENESYSPKIQDKIYRYFLLIFGILGFWIVRPKLNELNKKIKPSL